MIDEVSQSSGCGSLHMNGWLGDSRLTEYEPGLFFTADGESVAFEDGRMIYGSGCIHMRKADALVALHARLHPDPAQR